MWNAPPALIIGHRRLPPSPSTDIQPGGPGFFFQTGTAPPAPPTTLSLALSHKHMRAALRTVRRGRCLPRSFRQGGELCIGAPISTHLQPRHLGRVNYRNFGVHSRIAVRRDFSTTAEPEVVQVTEANFKDLVSGDIPILLDCYANWCDPCKKLAPVLKKVVAGYNGRVRLAVLDVDAMPGMSEQLGVTSLPTVFAICGGRIVNKFSGLTTEDKLKAFIDSFVPEELAEEADYEPDPNSAEGL